MQYTDDPLGRRLRTLRLQRALTQVELASLAHIARSTLIRLEQRGSRARPGTVRKLARALRVHPTAITIGD
jgi:transcriptional regulator with XRE-family HTH domain